MAEVLAFSKKSISSVGLDTCGPKVKPGLVAYFVSRVAAERMIMGDGVSLNSVNHPDITIPPSHYLVSVAVIESSSDDEERCILSLLSLFSYRPASCLQHGFVIVRKQAAGNFEVSLETNATDFGGMNMGDSRTRGLLVLKTIGYPLCTCDSVLEFLETMYNLLEVLRYLVQEKNILHRDVNWSNILIRPRETSRFSQSFKSSVRRVGKISEEEKPHTYRFVSDILKENEWKVRVALADFDHAYEVQTEQDARSRGRVGTVMFMAEDVLWVRNANTMILFSMISENVQDAALGPASRLGRDLSHSSTGRGERYEFHSHGFMQWLLLKEIKRMRAAGDPIFIEEDPLLVKTSYNAATDNYAYSKDKDVRGIHARKGMEDGMKDRSCRRNKNGLTNASSSNTLVLPVYRPKETPENGKEKFREPSGTF
ncbi:hypothetical protein A7U60_g1315 [Sanghuangporus baumii]|uniref:Protein kinase domain-containing protein n=1 Tax=Sanghuangporus baumii TaxID=108892 RepID=A0A9Q5I499_SANBA|nr:hypothetical protein A7U60_g1315 [Sanghuangporus baumii]